MGMVAGSSTRWIDTALTVAKQYRTMLGRVCLVVVVVVLTGGLRERLHGGGVLVPEPSLLHPGPLALRRRLRLRGPQRRGQLCAG